MSYTNLIADVPDFTARSDLTTAQLERFITLCEDKVNRMVRIAEMRKHVSQVAYSDPESTEVVFKTDREVVEPITIRAKNSSGDTLRTYDVTPDNAFREARSSKSKRPIWTPNPIAAIAATHYDGMTYGGKSGDLELSDATGAVFCVAFQADALPASGLWNSLFSIHDGSFPAFEIRFSSAGAIRLLTRSASGVQVNHTFTDFTVAAGTFHTLLISVDTVNQAVEAYFDNTTTADSVTVPNTEAILFSYDSLSIGETSTAAAVVPFLGNMCQLGLSLYDIATEPLTEGLDFDRVTNRTRFFTTAGVPVQYGTSRGIELFGKNAEIWIPDGSCDKNFGTEEGLEVLGGKISPYDTLADFGVVSNLYGVHINPAIGDGTEELELEYYGELPRLTSTVDTHWMADNHYDLYLFGCLAEAYDFLQNDAKEAQYREKFAGVAASINLANQRKLRGPGPFVRRNSRRSTP